MERKVFVRWNDDGLSIDNVLNVGVTRADQGNVLEVRTRTRTYNFPLRNVRYWTDTGR